MSAGRLRSISLRYFNTCPFLLTQDQTSTIVRYRPQCDTTLSSGTFFFSPGSFRDFFFCLIRRDLRTKPSDFDENRIVRFRLSDNFIRTCVVHDVCRIADRGRVNRANDESHVHILFNCISQRDVFVYYSLLAKLDSVLFPYNIIPCVVESYAYIRIYYLCALLVNTYIYIYC